MTKIQGGYVLISVGQFANVCAARRRRQIGFLALRVWLAAHEQRAKRCTAKKKRFTVEELARLLQESTASVHRALKELASGELISWSEAEIDFPRELTADGAELAPDFGTSPRRPVPVPRQILRALFRHKRPSEVMAAIGHLIRCLFIRAGTISNEGLVKASWIATTFGIAERSVHSARKWLTASGFLIAGVVHQLVMNRYGGKFTIALPLPEQAAQPVAHTLRTPTKSAPLRAQKGTQSAPPRGKQETPYGSKNQKPADAVHSGVCKTNGADTLERPRLSNIKLVDIQRLSRLRTLYADAIAANWLTPSDANLRNFIAAAARATRVNGDPVRVFVGIVRRGLWHHLTNDDEDRAIAALKREEESRTRTAVGLAGNSQRTDYERGGERIRKLVDIALNRNNSAAQRAVTG